MPDSIDATAPVIARHSRLIVAEPGVVWALHTDVDAWPRWRPEVVKVHSNGPFREGGTFAWSTAGIDITTTVYAVQPGVQTLWGGPARGIEAVHLWTFNTTNDGLEVYTEESWAGSAVTKDVSAMQKALDDSLVTWLNRLESAATSI